MIEKNIKIAALVRKAVWSSAELTPQERESLRAWLGEAEHNRQWFEKLPGDGLAEYDRTVTLSDQQEQFKKLQRKLHKKRHSLRGAWIAAAGLVLAAGLWALLARRGEVIARHMGGGAVAVLTLDDGRTVELPEATDTVLHTAQGNIRVNGGEIIYPETSSPEPQYNTITIPRGQTRALTLSDGTRVHLNSESTFTYPASFGRAERGVKLVGQAWFDVARDEAHPFVVDAGGMSVRVLGTEFDVAAYDNERLCTSLYEGSVEVAAASQSTVIIPGRQALVSGKGTIEVRDIPAGGHSTWRNGRLVLDEEELYSVMRTLARHYDMGVVVEHKIPNVYTFTGSIDLGDPLETILATLTRLGGPQFRVENNNIYIK